jgi:hypothetical protein
MKKTFPLLAALFYFVNVDAASITVVREKYVVDEIAEFKSIMETLKPYGGFAAKDLPLEKPQTPVPVKDKEMTQGQRMVEEAKARNRAILAGMKEDDKKIMDQKDSGSIDEMKRLREETKRVHEGWKKEIRETRAQWKREQDIFLGRLKVYEENTFVIPAPKEKIVEQKEIPSLPDVHIVNQAFTPPVRDQKDRPTCSAFAGVRVMEIILAQNKIERDLSEQYFYWASKPSCQSSPCAEKGSWIVHGLNHSRDQRSVDIPTETNCTYKEEPLPQNETQLPMTPGCRQGVTKVEQYEPVKTLSDVIARLKQDVPVIISAKLTPNFYLNKGLITLADENKGRDQMDGHSLGHAFIAVGVIELPEKIQRAEGRYCLVVTNSWGKGWGAGGYSCITENWMLKNRSQNSFVAVTKIGIN